MRVYHADTTVDPGVSSDIGLEETIRCLAIKDFASFINLQAMLRPADDPVKWWRDEGARMFAYVEPVARRYFSALASTAQVERSFKKAKVWCGNDRGRISDHMLNMMTVLSNVVGRPGFNLERVFDDNPFASSSSAVV